jgi:uncharacterized protein YkwD
VNTTRVSPALALLIALVAAPGAALAVDAAKGITQPAPSADQARQLVAEAAELERQGNLEGALGRLQAAVATLPNWAHPRGLLARIHQLLGEDEQAKAEYGNHQLLGLLEETQGDADPLIPKQAEAEGLIAFLVNQERMTRGLYVLVPSVELSRVARRHSTEMRELDYFGHVSPVPKHRTSVDRFQEVYGCKPRGLAENLARRRGTLYCFTLEKVAETHADLMKSPKHRDSILWDKVREIGVGIAVNDHGDYWVTEMFARRR